MPACMAPPIGDGIDCELKVYRPPWPEGGTTGKSRPRRISDYLELRTGGTGLPTPTLRDPGRTSLS
jgi:hypothetical protein